MNSDNPFEGNILGGQGLFQGGLLENATLGDSEFLGLTDLLQSMGQRSAGAMDVPQISAFVPSDEPSTSNRQPDLPLTGANAA
jgi:hypothetical protein